MCIISKY